jgi:Family of unknown function (DUF5309)
MPKRRAVSSKSEWVEDEMHPRQTVCSASFTNVATVVNVLAGTGSYFKVNDLIRDEQTGENMLITSIATDALTVTRPIGSFVSVASSGSADTIIRVSNASQQGSTYPTLKQTQKVGQFNYQQLIRTSGGFVGTAARESWRAQTDVYGYEKAKKLKEHKREIEHAVWLGRRFTQSSPPQLFMGGFLEFIQTNILTIGGNLTQVNFEQWLRDYVFAYGDTSGTNKLIVASPMIGSAIASFPLGRAAPADVTTVTKWGVSLRQYISASTGETINVLIHQDWRKFATASPGLAGTAVSVDMDNVYLKSLLDTTLRDNIQNPGDDQRIFEYMTETTLCVKHERKHAVLRGVTGF